MKTLESSHPTAGATFSAGTGSRAELQLAQGKGVQLSFEDFPGGVVVVGRGWVKAGNKAKAQLQLGLQAA